ESAFIGCINLKSVTLGDAVKRIEAKAFKNIGLSEINIPESVEVIGAEAFSADPPVDLQLPGIEPVIYESLPEITIPRTVRLLGALAKQQGEPPTSGIYVPPVLPLKEDPVCVFGKDCVISGYIGTEAERYAKEWGLQFIALESVPGDTNADGVFNVADAVLLARYLAGDAQLADWKTADRNGDGSLDARDLTLLLRDLAYAGKNA
ncbi:MAG: leucine-rich repeat protein, partial [Oscillospiraceae bacterium]|nr:leucine-rich repeat protein [Oscillospiraceae bacterium]